MVETSARVACPHCGGGIHPLAVICKHCKTDLAGVPKRPVPLFGSLGVAAAAVLLTIAQAVRLAAEREYGRIPFLLVVAALLGASAFGMYRLRPWARWAFFLIFGFMTLSASLVLVASLGAKATEFSNEQVSVARLYNSTKLVLGAFGLSFLIAARHYFRKPTITSGA